MPVVGCLPDATAGRAHIKRVWLSAMPGHRRHAPAAMRADVAVAQTLKKFRVDSFGCILLRGENPTAGDRAEQREKDSQRDARPRPHAERCRHHMKPPD